MTHNKRQYHSRAVHSKILPASSGRQHQEKCSKKMPEHNEIPARSGGVFCCVGTNVKKDTDDGRGKQDTKRQTSRYNRQRSKTRQEDDSDELHTKLIEKGE
ncbi:hypothetical protein D3C87_1839000 [compost metagenome]